MKQTTMTKLNIVARHTGSISITLIVGIVLGISGCNVETNDQKNARIDAKAAEQRRLSEAREKNVLTALIKKHNATEFPPDGTKDTVYTYELQTAISQVANGIIVFKGTLEDIEETKQGVVISIDCPIGNRFMSDVKVHFRLLTTRSSAEQFMMTKPKERVLHGLVDNWFLIVARINSLTKVHRYEFVGDSFPSKSDENANDVIMSINIPRNYSMTGDMVDALPAPPGGW